MNFNTLQRLSCPSRAWDRYCDEFEKDPWDYYSEDDFKPVDLVSACCGGEVTIAKNGAKICNECCKFCAIDPQESMKRLADRVTEEAEESRVDRMIDAMEVY